MEATSNEIASIFVRAKGVEPIHLTALDPKSSLSTNFNTPASRKTNCFNVSKSSSLYYISNRISARE